MSTGILTPKQEAEVEVRIAAACAQVRLECELGAVVAQATAANAPTMRAALKRAAQAFHQAYQQYGDLIPEAEVHDYFRALDAIAQRL